MAKYFVGFGSFCCKDAIWDKFFPDTKEGNQKIKDSLSIEVIEEENSKTRKITQNHKLDSDGLWHMVKGDSRCWGKYAKVFLGYNKEYEDRYYKRWDTLNFFTLEKCKPIFAAFQESILEYEETLVVTFRESLPEYEEKLVNAFRESLPKYEEESFKDFWKSLPESEYKETCRKYLTPAKEICEYLSEVERYFALPIEHNRKWLNASMYVLLCLFLQNRKDAKPEYREPPEKYSLKNLRTLIANNGEEPKEAEPSAQSIYREADVIFHSPELEALPFDLFAQAKAFFEKEGESSRYKPLDPVITPAEVRRKRVPYSKTHTVGEVFSSFCTGVFLYEDFPIGENDSAEYLGHRVRFVTSTSDGINRTFRLEGTCFEDETMEAFELIIQDQSENQYILPLRFDDHTVGPAFVNDTFRIDIDGYGYPRSHSVDRLMKSYQIQEEVQPYSTLRRYTIPLRREYLNYQIINAETMEVLPMQRSRDQQGQEQLNVVIPGPCKLVILKNEPTALSEEERLLLYIRGYLHGLYGLKKSLFQAMLEMKAGLYHLDRQCARQCAFQYGVYLRTQGDAAAEGYLRRAAEDIPGAQFELAMLLLERDPFSPEAEILLDDLWAEGYRYYGLTSIDLMNKHQS